MKNELQRQAYLLDDVGVIWRGTESQRVPLHWQYGQVCHTSELVSPASWFFAGKN